MDPQSLVIIMRMLERILGVLIGGVLIYFGYRLFLDLRGRRAADGGSGDFTIAGGNKLKLSKVGPGVFFALFGTALIVFSLTRTVSLTTAGEAAPAEKPAGGSSSVATVTFMGATSLPEGEAERAQHRAEMQQQIVVLNRTVSRAAEAERAALAQAVAHAKLALMERLWAEEWGDVADFREWLEKGGAPQDSIQQAVQVYQAQ